MKVDIMFKGLAVLLSLNGVIATPSQGLKCRDTAEGNACSSVAKPRVSVKQVSSFCETTPGVKSYSGYVTLPPSTNYPFEQNLFFWFFESRNRPKSDPLTVWINGGPGSPSTEQALGSNGPCRVQTDSSTTKLNPDSWNNKANLLYIDQPVQTGFSYNEALPGRLGLLSGLVYPAGTPASDEDPVLFDGVFSSQRPEQTLNTTQSVARVMWDFMQVWQAEKKFKDYVRPSINLGGHWVPGIATHFEAQSTLAAAGALPPSARICSRARPIRISTVGIIAPVIDIAIQNTALEYAFNNTYGIEIFNKETVERMREESNATGGCLDKIEACRIAATSLDPEGWGNIPEVHDTCFNAFLTCYAVTEGPYEAQGRDVFDITQSIAAQFPPPYAFGFLNRPATQSRLGVPVNYTTFTPQIQLPFIRTGDFLASFRPHIERLLAADIPVHLIHGDRDWRANWLGGQALALALNHRHRARFAAAGYTPLQVQARGPGTSPSSSAGHVRQAGRLSFTVVANAGHEVPYYQPTAAYAIYQRALDGRDVATGRVAVGDGARYATAGVGDIRGVRVPLPRPAPVFCYVASTPIMKGQCTDAQIAALANGTAVVEDFIVVEPAWSS
ncbi:hypothetical protein ACHAQA_000667 [Verticillium albo-atrum]